MIQPEIIAIGEPMLEFNAEEEGALSEVGRFVVGWGGDTSNFCIAASRAGGRVGYLTRLGEDEFGESFLTLWQREGIDTRRIVKDPDAFTAPTSSPARAGSTISPISGGIRPPAA